MPVRLAITMGDFNGIGPEIILKSLPKIQESEATPVIIGKRGVFEFYANKLNLPIPDYYHINDAGLIRDEAVNLLDDSPVNPIEPTPGELSKTAGKEAMLAVEKGIECCLQNQADALITAPISKEAVNKAGYRIPGHTEFLAEKTGTDQYLMTMVHDQLRMGLVTTHIPVSDIAKEIDTNRILKNIGIMNRSLKDDFNISQPRIAVLGLNPHAGDGGIIGKEEKTIIQPALSQAQSNNIDASGPFPADGFFGSRMYRQYDGVLAMYHDQGMGPFKTISFGSGVNYTAGLPIIRTSPDHGTAFDIAGENKANPDSFLAASKLAIKLSSNRLKKA